LENEGLGADDKADNSLPVNRMTKNSKTDPIISDGKKIPAIVIQEDQIPEDQNDFDNLLQNVKAS